MEVFKWALVVTIVTLAVFVSLIVYSDKQVQQEIAHGAAVVGVLDASTCLPTEFRAAVAQSQKLAVSKCPELAVFGSQTNQKFRARYQQWTEQNDGRLSRADWPERLVDDVLNHP